MLIVDVDAESIDWNYVKTIDNVNGMVSLFNDIILNLFDLHAPEKKIFIREQSYPWITYTLKLMMQLRDDAHARYRASKNEIHKQYYKDLKKAVINALESDRRAYFDQYINANLKNPAVLWKNLKKTVLSKDKSVVLPYHLSDPECINNSFLDVPGSNEISISQLTYYEHNRFCNNSLKLETITQDKVLKALRLLKSSAKGFDNVNLDMIMLTLPHSLEAITCIINRSITTSTFPELWKIAVVKPIPKTSNPSTFKDLRPISILPCLSKVLERVIYEQVSSYVEFNSILPEVQSGFRKGRSTATALLDVTDNILTAQDQGMGTVLVLLDYSRAFDCINSTLLLSKLSYFGFDTGATKWFHSYLLNRLQMVEATKADGSKALSPLRSVPRGVPQGSILGPLLFVLYCSDIVETIQNCQYHIYADDLQLYLSFPPIHTSQATVRLNQDLKQIALWSRKNSLVLNPNKSKYLILGSKKQIDDIAAQSPDVNILGVPVIRTNEARNLGVIMDSELRFETHITECVRNCFYRLKVLYRIRDCLDVDLRVNLSESLILSKLNYADIVYGPRLFARTEKLIQRVHNACARFCFRIPPRAHVTPYINAAKLIKMSWRRHLHFAVLLFGVIKSRKPYYLFKKLHWFRDGNSYNTRAASALLLATPLHGSAAFRGSFRFAATKCWNDIPPPLRNINNINLFKIKLKRHIFALQVDQPWVA